MQFKGAGREGLHGMTLSSVSKKTDLGLAEEKVGIEKRIEALKQGPGLFGVLFVISKDSTMHHGWRTMLVFFHFLQVLYKYFMRLFLPVCCYRALGKGVPI